MIDYGDRWIDIHELDADSGIELDKLAELIPKLQEKYGKKAILGFDAGANNVQAIINPTKKQKTK